MRIEVEKLPFEGDYRVVTNLQSDFGLDDQSAHRVVEQALLAMAGLGQRIHLMEALNAVTGFRDVEAPIFEARLAFFAEQLDPDAQEEQFRRAVILGDLPSIEALGPIAKVAMKKLLHLRDDPDVVDLRRWLRSTDGLSDREIEQQFNSVKEKLAGLWQLRTGKALRFVAALGLGTLGPLGGIPLGVAISLADKLIIDRLIGSPGPICFLSRKYNSIYDPTFKF